MAALETLTFCLAPALSKAILKLWLKDSPITLAAGDGVIEFLKKRGEEFSTIDATDRLFRNLASEVAERLNKVIEAEFSNLPESDRDAAILAVADRFSRVDITREMMQANLSSIDLENVLRLQTQPSFSDLGEGGKSLAELLLRESCAYSVSIADKLPDFRVAATKELLKRTAELVSDLARVLDIVSSMRKSSDVDDETANFDAQYRRAVVHRLDRMHLFGVDLIGAGAREPEISIAYVTLTSKNRQAAHAEDVDIALAEVTRALIRGEAGSGKTTLLQWIAIRAASRDFSGVLAPWNERIPLYVYLRDYSDGTFPAPEMIPVGLAENLAGCMPSQWVHRELRRGALLLLDGVDEVHAKRRQELFEWIRCLVEDFPKTVVVVSSRPAALDAPVAGRPAASHLEALGFEEITLEPMTLADIESVIIQWHRAVGRDFADEEKIATLDRYERDLIRVVHDRPVIRSLSSNPLLCSMICMLNWDRKQRLPDNRMALYELALNMLIEGRDADRGVKSVRYIELDRPAKESLLDGVAYWMMRNDVTEAPREDVEEQISTLLQRLAKVPQDAPGVVQELVERSGVLRQPQVGIIDFAHRTFLEYAAARAAVKAGDFGFLASKAREDGWRETVIFAAGHAQGKQRDKFIAQLLKKSILPGRNRRGDITAACCLETAEAELDSNLRAKLRECAQHLFPPRTIEMARILAPAAQSDPTLLMGYAGDDEAIIESCIRCAAMCGGEHMLDVVASYASVPGEGVWYELLLAWSAFNADNYLQRVIMMRQTQAVGGKTIATCSDDEVRCLQLFALKGAFEKSGRVLNQKMSDFAENRAITFDRVVRDLKHGQPSLNASAHGAGPVRRPGLQSEGNAYRPLKTSLAEARLISQITSTRSLTLGLCDRGVLTAISNLSSLRSLSCSLTDASDAASLPKFAELRRLEIDDRGAPHSARNTPLDLRALNLCGELKELVVVGSCLLPSGSKIESLSATKIQLNDMAQIAFFPMLRELYLNISLVETATVDIQHLESLESFELWKPGLVDLVLPRSLSFLSVNLCSGVSILNYNELPKLHKLVAFYTTIWGLKIILAKSKIMELWIDEMSFGAGAFSDADKDFSVFKFRGGKVHLISLSEENRV